VRKVTGVGCLTVPPIRSQDQPVENLLRDVVRGKIAFSASCWRKVSSEARQVVRGLLTVDPADRMQIPALRAHPWLEAELGRLRHELTTEPPHASAPVTIAPRVASHSARHYEDLELLGALSFLPTTLARGGMQPSLDAPPLFCPGDLRLHVLSDSREGPVRLFTVRVEDNRQAFILEGRQDALPVAAVACRRSQLLRWIAGEASLLPVSFELPAGSRLATFLRNFALDAQRFRTFCLEKGVVLERATRRRPGGGSERPVGASWSAAKPGKPGCQSVRVAMGTTTATTAVQSL